MTRIYVERKRGFENEARSILFEAKNFLGVSGITAVRYLNRYDIENASAALAKEAAKKIFSEPQSDEVFFTPPKLREGETQIVWEYLPGQFDQRADSAEQCLLLLQHALFSKKNSATKNSTKEKSAQKNSSKNSYEENSTKENSAPKKIRNLEKPIVRAAKIVILCGNISASDAKKIQDYLVNPVDSRLASGQIPKTLKIRCAPPAFIPTVVGFTKFTKGQLEDYAKKMGLAMDTADIKFLQDYFLKEGRDPTETEIRVLDTYWSDHCRHTTFLTELSQIKIQKGPYEKLFKSSLKKYEAMREAVYKNPSEKPVTLMDMAVIGMKYLKKRGKLSDLETSSENNACSIFIDVNCTCNERGKKLKTPQTEKWLLQFKNETHNHPTEIEPFGGAATCIGGAIRDPLSGRAWVYQAMRITGAADPTAPLSKTLRGKLPQLKIVRESAQGFSSYGNQIGLATGQVQEFYHEGYAAKRMELGAVIAAVPKENVIRGNPQTGDVVILLGGGTGRDGIGGATGSSKAHTTQSVETASAEVQKGNAVEERKIQRLFRNARVAKMIVRCNDFGAGGVAVAVGELSSGLEINLSLVPKKYEGLDGTELAISESQERMAVVVRASDEKKFIAAARAENLRAVAIAKVTDTKRLVMKWEGKAIVDLSRDFLDSAGARHTANALIESPAEVAASPLLRPLDSVEKILCEKNSSMENSSEKKSTENFASENSSAENFASENSSMENSSAENFVSENFATKNSASKKNSSLDLAKKIKAAWLLNIAHLACCSQRGLCERFDGSIGAASVLFPFGGKFQCTPEAGMAAKIPVSPPQETDTASIMTSGFDPRISQWSAWHGSQVAVLFSLAKILCLGGNPLNARLSFQEFFGRAVSEKTWGYPAAALLGSLEAQAAMETASIGGKDSMSGTFESLNVPHTLVSFAVACERAQNITSGSFKKSGSKIFLVRVPYSDLLVPDFAAFKKNSQILYGLNSAKKNHAMYPVAAGGVAEAVTKMAFGNRIGVRIFWDAILGEAQKFFIPLYGSVIVETDADLTEEKFVEGTVQLLGVTICEQKIVLCHSDCGKQTVPNEKNFRSQKKAGFLDFCEIAICEAESAWEKTLSKVFPQVGKKENSPLPKFAKTLHPSFEKMQKKIFLRSEDEKKSANKKLRFYVSNSQAAKPRVLLPVFPGTNCEYDMARAFDLAGAKTKILVFKNDSAAALERSLFELAKEIEGSQILALSGGFSAGDEPDGSGKYIANVLRQGSVAEKIMTLLKKRGGLVLGICNGFQALIKTGLVPYGEIREPNSQMPTLTFNTVGRHVSRIVRTRIASAKSPWANHPSILQSGVHLVPVSHGEGRIIIREKLAKTLFENGQIFSQYVDENGLPTMSEPQNPNGSFYAIEGMTSGDGRVLGKMGHNERAIGCEKNGEAFDLLKNVAATFKKEACGTGQNANGLQQNAGESLCQNIFAAGVNFFK